ncbi:MAG: hypothetical protein ACI9IA_001987 [Enterobacterales bacterium]|jgi:hypothetical protein
MNKEIQIKKVPSRIKILGMTAKSVRGITEDGKTIYESNLQLELKNIGKRPLSFVECTLSYHSESNEFLGFDSDGSFSIIKPEDIFYISIPALHPDGVFSKYLDITADVSQSAFTRYISWVLLGSVTLFWVYQNYAA